MCGISAACAIVLLLLFPLPRKTGAKREAYACVWEDGTSTEETYLSAYSALSGVEDGGEMLLSREGKTGVISPSDAFSHFIGTLSYGEFPDLLDLRSSELRRIERAAAYRLCSGRVWMSGGQSYVYDGERFLPETIGEVKEVDLMDGKISARSLISSGATSLRIFPNAEFDEKTLEGTAVRTVAALPPYSAENEGVYLDTPSGRRLLCGLPHVLDFEMAECRFADEGALLPCTNVRSLTLLFVGNGPNNAGSYFRGELAHLFSTGKEYLVPASLERVRVTGGVLVSHAFYRCRMLKEIDACGVDAEKIEEDAFLDVTDLKLLHSPRTDVRLQGDFRTTLLPCGCTLFERIENTEGV